MGYTHHWYRRKEIRQDVFDLILRDFKLARPTLEEEMGFKLADGFGSADSVPQLDSLAIIFNGPSSECHETLYFPRTDDEQMRPDGTVFGFTKTNRKTYDLAVTALLVIAKHHLGTDIKVSSDGDLPEWADAVLVTKKVLGYGEDFVLDKG